MKRDEYNINIIKERLKKLIPNEWDTIDVTALYDSSITMDENWGIIKEYVNPLLGIDNSFEDVAKNMFESQEGYVSNYYSNRKEKHRQHIINRNLHRKALKTPYSYYGGVYYCDSIPKNLLDVGRQKSKHTNKQNKDKLTTINKMNPLSQILKVNRAVPIKQSNKGTIKNTNENYDDYTLFNRGVDKRISKTPYTNNPIPFHTYK